jgi:hypothetical protein
VPQQNNANNSSSLATPISPGSSFQSYFFSSTIPNTLSQATSSASTKSTAIPTTPPPEATSDYYPPLTPPSFSDQTNFHPSICVECRSGANAPTTFTLDRIKSNVACAPAPLSFKEIFHLECGGSLTAGVNPEAFPPSASSLSNFARQENVDVSAHQTMRRATAAGLVGGYQMINTMLQTQITHLVNMAFFINQVTNSSPNTSSAAAAVASGLSSPTSPSSPPSSFNNNNSLTGRRSPTNQQQQQQQQRPHQVLIHCVDGYTETALLALATVMVHYRFTLAEAYVKMQTDLGRSFFVYPNDAIMMLEVEAQIWQRLVSEKNGPNKNAVSTAIPTASSTSLSSSGMSSLSSSVSSTSSTFFSSLLNMSNQPSQQGQQQKQSEVSEQEQEPEQDSENGNMAMEGLESTPNQEPITPAIVTPPPTTIKTTNNNFATAHPFARPEHLEKFGWFYDPEFEGSFPSRILPFLYLGNLAHASNPGLLKSLGIQYVLSVGEEAHGLKVHMGEVGEENKATQFMVKLVDDMFDNGVDPLWRHIENSVAFVGKLLFFFFLCSYPSSTNDSSPYSFPPFSKQLKREDLTYVQILFHFLNRRGKKEQYEGINPLPRGCFTVCNNRDRLPDGPLQSLPRRCIPDGPRSSPQRDHSTQPPVHVRASPMGTAPSRPVRFYGLARYCERGTSSQHVLHRLKYTMLPLCKNKLECHPLTPFFLSLSFNIASSPALFSSLNIASSPLFCFFTYDI